MKSIRRLAAWKFLRSTRFRRLRYCLAEAYLPKRCCDFLRYPPSQWKSLRTTNAIERLREEFKRRIKTQCVLPTAETACMLFGALLARGQSPCDGSTAGTPSRSSQIKSRLT